jgi:hypothetical protein
MVTSVNIRKVTARDRVVLDLDVWMDNPDDHDFSPRVRLAGSTIELSNEGSDGTLASIELDDDALAMAERDRVVEARIKFSVHGMHGILVHKTGNPRDGPKAKKLAEPRWKTVLPLF